jgi:hypothetical protein
MMRLEDIRREVSVHQQPCIPNDTLQLKTKNIYSLARTFSSHHLKLNARLRLDTSSWSSKAISSGNTWTQLGLIAK